MSWFSEQLASETFLIIRRIGRDMIRNLLGWECEVCVI